MNPMETIITLRIFNLVIEEARENVEAHPDMYENLSHYVRAAIIQLNNKHKDGQITR